MRVIIEPNGGQVSAWGAAYIAKRINEHNKKEKRPFVQIGRASCRERV